MKSFLIFAVTGFAAFAVAETSQDYSFLIKQTEEAAAISNDEYRKINDAYMRKLETDNTVSTELVNKLKEAQSKVFIANEAYAARLEKSLLVKIRSSVENMKSDEVKQFLSEGISFSDFNALSDNKNKNGKDLGGISLNSVRKFNTSKGAQEFVKSLDRYIAQFKKIDFVDLKLTDLSAPQLKEFVGTQIFSEARELNAKIFFEIRGQDLAGKSRVDKIHSAMQLTKNKNSHLISGFNFENYQSLVLNREPAFQKISANAGFDSGKVYPRLEALRRGGYGFAVEDFNNDGHLDAFVGNYGESTLWVGTEDGQFKQLASAEINKVTLAKAASFVDLDNDGWKDLVVTRFAADKLVGDILVYKNEKGSLKEVKNAFPSEILRDYAMPMAVADYNNDGLLDIYIGFPGERDFSAAPPNRDGKVSVHGLFINNGSFKFKDSTLNIENAMVGSVMPHGALASDFNMDGLVDILVMDDQKNLSPMYQNTGTGFVAKNSYLKITNYGYGMGVAAGDFDQDGRQDYVLSNASFTPQCRLAKAHNVRLYSTVSPSVEVCKATGARLFLNSDKKGFRETTDMAGLTDAGEAAGGVTVIDYDNDGLLDLYLVNGLWSGSSRDENIDSLFAKAIQLGLVNQDHLQDGMGDRSPRGTRSIFMKVLMQDKVEVDGKEKSLSFAGYQRNRLFKNLGNGQFIDVGYLEGVDSQADGYMSVVADLNKDGKPDLLLRNCDPGAQDNMFAPIEVYRNNLNKNKSVIIALKGKKSNAMGVGAKVFATIKGKTHMREVMANNSAVQGEVMIHFGLGTADKITKLKIQWPSGHTDTHYNIKPGKHNIEEKLGAMAAH